MKALLQAGPNGRACPAKPAGRSRVPVLPEKRFLIRVDGVYVDAESHPQICNQNGSRWLRPAWFEAYGCIRGPMIEPAIMEKTYERAARELRSGEWKGNLWGCDYRAPGFPDDGSWDVKWEGLKKSP